MIGVNFPMWMKFELFLLPPRVNVMALTATAMKSLHTTVCRILGMKNPYVVTVSPDKYTSLFLELTYQRTYKNDGLDNQLL